MTLKTKLKKIQNKAKSVSAKIKRLDQIIEHPMASAGGAIGAKLGNRRAGAAIGNAIGRITGTGDYTIRSNSLATVGGAVDSAPSFQRKGRGFRITHREYVGPVVASAAAGAFQNTSYAVNPSNKLMFPWLSQIAANFDQWQPNGIVVTYKSLSSTYSGTASLGAVVLASDYDVYDSTYASKIEMENSEFVVSGNCARDLIHPIECNLAERFTKVLNTRNGMVPPTDSLRFYDLCNFQVATQGATANQVCGELWVSYDVTFFKEQLGGLTGSSILSYNWTAFNYNIASGLFSGAATIKTNMDVNLFNAGGGGDIQISSRYAGATFLITLYVTGGSATVTAPTYALTDMTLVTGVINTSGVNRPTGTMSGEMIEFLVKISATNNQYTVLSISDWTQPTDPCSVYLNITQINNS